MSRAEVLSGTSTPSSAAAVHPWARSYANRLIFTDVAVVIFSVFGTQLAVTGRSNPLVYTEISFITSALWVLVLALYATRDHKITGNGSTEYKRIADATLRLFGLAAIAVFLFKLELTRSYFLLALPIGFVLLVISRWIWRQWLNRQRMQGRYSSQVLLVGSRESAGEFADTIARQPLAGLKVIAALVPHGNPGEKVSGIPILGDLGQVIPTLDHVEVDTIVLTSSDRLPPKLVRQLSWDLEAKGINLIVAPALTDVAGPRIHARPVAGLPLIHVEFPTFDGPKHAAKRTFDVVCSGLGLLVLSPLFLWIAVAIRRGSTGPVFFQQERVGFNGELFKMIKFRSMVTDAEAQLAALRDQSEGNGVLFKMKDDPRVTRIGKVLRKYSLDEIPQLWNVFRGDMSLVGPRPPLASEVATYETAANRRFLVKPGITGLWQVSGRSELSWDDSVRLDLYYVENWSLAGDLVILGRTAKAVAFADGAY